MLNHRLQVLIDEERHKRLAVEAERRGVAVAEIVREAIDEKLAEVAASKRQAWQRLQAAFDADPMEIPATVEELKAEIAAAHDRP